MNLEFLCARMVAADAASLSETKREVFADDVYQLQPRENDPRIETVLDIGANVGSFTILARYLFPHARIVCVEAHPVNFECLTQNLHMNGIAAGIESVHLAMGDGRTLRCCYEQHGSGCSRFSPDGTGAPVDSMTLTQMLKRFGIRTAGLLLKIDCEGGEASLLSDPGAREILGAVESGVMELHYPPDRAVVNRWLEFLHSVTDCRYDPNLKPDGPVSGGNTLVWFGTWPEKVVQPALPLPELERPIVLKTPRLVQLRDPSTGDWKVGVA